MISLTRLIVISRTQLSNSRANFSKRSFLAMASLLFVEVVISTKGIAGELNQESTQTIGDRQVHYSVFNSTFLQPNIAKHYELVRAGNQVLINIAVQDLEGNPVAAIVAGYAENLMQQKKTLSFKTIEEPDAIYALASLRTTNEEVFDFHISWQEPDRETQTIRFTRKLYTEQ